MNTRSLLIFALILSLNACSLTKQPPQFFATPDQAMKALEDVVASENVSSADKLFGSEGDYILHTGDATLDKQRGRKFVDLFNEKHALQKNDKGDYIVVIGKKNWPFPVPLTWNKDGWFFDADAGREEILTRRVGANELSAIDVARQVYLAQRAYARVDWENTGVRKYADRFISSPGKKDGLYWPADEGEVASPFGPLVLQAAEENYKADLSGKPQPYRGYYYKLFTSPGDNSDALTKPGKYWLFVRPAQWGVTGVMTFAMNERGWIYQKDFGEELKISDSAPPSVDDTWQRIE